MKDDKENEELPPSEQERLIDEAAARVLEKYRKAFEKLAE